MGRREAGKVGKGTLKEDTTTEGQLRIDFEVLDTSYIVVRKIEKNIYNNN
jgi:hypothetical protein